MKPARWLLGALAASVLCVASCGDDDSGNSSDGGKLDASTDNGGAGDAMCGNGVAQGVELCDGNDLRFQTCTSATHGVMSRGTLACKPDCTFDVSNCTGEGGGAGSGNRSDGGSSDAGTLDASTGAGDAGKATCGNGVAQGDELCDGHDLRFRTCRRVTHGVMSGGALACKSDCTFDVSHCTGEEGDGGQDDGGAGP